MYLFEISRERLKYYIHSNFFYLFMFINNLNIEKIFVYVTVLIPGPTITQEQKIVDSSNAKLFFISKIKNYLDFRFFSFRTSSQKKQ